MIFYIEKSQENIENILLFKFGMISNKCLNSKDHLNVVVKILFICDFALFSMYKNNKCVTLLFNSKKKVNIIQYLYARFVSQYLCDLRIKSILIIEFFYIHINIVFSEFFENHDFVLCYYYV